MAIELAITDETPENQADTGLSDQDILDCFLAAPLNGSYREYLLRAGRAIEAKAVGETEDIGKCPYCGETGVGFHEADRPSDYCGHDIALVRARR